MLGNATSEEDALYKTNQISWKVKSSLNSSLSCTLPNLYYNISVLMSIAVAAYTPLLSIGVFGHGTFLLPLCLKYCFCCFFL